MDAETTTTTAPDTNHHNSDSSQITFRPLGSADGADLWHLTKATEVLDLNSSYYYLLWARDFGATSVVAERATHADEGTELIGFITGYLRPDAPDTLLVWQVAVAESARGAGVASRMLDALVAQTGAQALETTITDDNEGSKALFSSLAKRHSAGHDVIPLFTPEMYPDGHDTEFLHRISPLRTPQ